MLVTISICIWWIVVEIKTLNDDESKYLYDKRDECTIIDYDIIKCDLNEGGAGLEYEYIVTAKNCSDHYPNITLMSVDNECYENNSNSVILKMNNTYTCYLNKCEDELFSFSNNGDISDDEAANNTIILLTIIATLALVCCCIFCAQCRKELNDPTATKKFKPRPALKVKLLNKKAQQIEAASSHYIAEDPDDDL